MESGCAHIPTSLPMTAIFTDSVYDVVGTAEFECRRSRPLFLGLRSDTLTPSIFDSRWVFQGRDPSAPIAWLPHWFGLSYSLTVFSQHTHFSSFFSSHLSAVSISAQFFRTRYRSFLLNLHFPSNKPQPSSLDPKSAIQVVTIFLKPL